ncbi:MAG TPA: hypothetical protein DDW31_07395 [candidate division Zixibacteria bacterium]|nr:hypothetical protein [candidate division Zixibacteria bacterium]
MKERANRETVISTALMKRARGRSERKIRARDRGLRENSIRPVAAPSWTSPAENVIMMDTRFRAPVIRAMTVTVKNLPRNRSRLSTGAASMVSMVPRSFSPAVRSMAGYMAPIIMVTMRRMGSRMPSTMPPMREGGAVFSARKANGSSSRVSSPARARSRRCRPDL